MFKHTQIEGSQFWFIHTNPIDTSGSSDTDWREYMAVKWEQNVCPHDFGKRLLCRRKSVSLPKVSPFRQRSVYFSLQQSKQAFEQAKLWVISSSYKKRKTRFILLLSIQTMMKFSHKNFGFTGGQTQHTMRISHG